MCKKNIFIKKLWPKHGIFTICAVFVIKIWFVTLKPWFTEFMVNRVYGKHKRGVYGSAYSGIYFVCYIQYFKICKFCDIKDIFYDF